MEALEFVLVHADVEMTEPMYGASARGADSAREGIIGGRGEERRI